MNIYQNPHWIVRMIVIAAGLILCAVAGHAQSIVFLGIGLATAIFGVAWGDRAYLGFLWRIVLKAKDIAVSVISGIIRAILLK